MPKEKHRGLMPPIKMSVISFWEIFFKLGVGRLSIKGIW